MQNCKNNNEANNTVDCYNSASDNKVYGIYKCVDSNTIKVNNNSTILVIESPIPEFPDTNTTQINSTITDIPTTETPSNSMPVTSDFKTTNKYISVFSCIVINLIVMNYI